jgi:hypothetical protein
LRDGLSTALGHGKIRNLGRWRWSCDRGLAYIATRLIRCRIVMHLGNDLARLRSRHTRSRTCTLVLLIEILAQLLKGLQKRVRVSAAASEISVHKILCFFRNFVRLNDFAVLVRPVFLAGLGIGKHLRGTGGRR